MGLLDALADALDPSGRSVQGFLGNVVSSAGDIGEGILDIGQAVGSDIASLAPGGEAPSFETTGQLATQLPGAIGSHFKENYLDPLAALAPGGTPAGEGIAQFGRYAYERPADLALDALGFQQALTPGSLTRRGISAATKPARQFLQNNPELVSGVSDILQTGAQTGFAAPSGQAAAGLAMAVPLPGGGSFQIPPQLHNHVAALRQRGYDPQTVAGVLDALDGMDDIPDSTQELFALADEIANHQRQLTQSDPTARDILNYSARRLPHEQTIPGAELPGAVLPAQRAESALAGAPQTAQPLTALPDPNAPGGSQGFPAGTPWYDKPPPQRVGAVAGTTRALPGELDQRTLAALADEAMGGTTSFRAETFPSDPDMLRNFAREEHEPLTPEARVAASRNIVETPEERMSLMSDSPQVEDLAEIASDYIRRMRSMGREPSWEATVLYLQKQMKPSAAASTTPDIANPSKQVRVTGEEGDQMMRRFIEREAGAELPFTGRVSEPGETGAKLDLRALTAEQVSGLQQRYGRNWQSVVEGLYAPVRVGDETAIRNVANQSTMGQVVEETAKDLGASPRIGRMRSNERDLALIRSNWDQMPDEDLARLARMYEIEDLSKNPDVPTPVLDWYRTSKGYDVRPEPGVIDREARQAFQATMPKGAQGEARLPLTLRRNIIKRLQGERRNAMENLRSEIGQLQRAVDEGVMVDTAQVKQLAEIGLSADEIRAAIDSGRLATKPVKPEAVNAITQRLYQARETFAAMGGDPDQLGAPVRQSAQPDILEARGMSPWQAASTLNRESRSVGRFINRADEEAARRAASTGPEVPERPVVGGEFDPESEFDLIEAQPLDPLSQLLRPGQTVQQGGRRLQKELTPGQARRYARKSNRAQMTERDPLHDPVLKPRKRSDQLDAKEAEVAQAVPAPEAPEAPASEAVAQADVAERLDEVVGTEVPPPLDPRYPTEVIETRVRDLKGRLGENFDRMAAEELLDPMVGQAISPEQAEYVLDTVFGIGTEFDLFNDAILAERFGPAVSSEPVVGTAVRRTREPAKTTAATRQMDFDEARFDKVLDELYDLWVRGGKKGQAPSPRMAAERLTGMSLTKPGAGATKAPPQKDLLAFAQERYRARGGHGALTKAAESRNPASSGTRQRTGRTGTARRGRRS